VGPIARPDAAAVPVVVFATLVLTALTAPWLVRHPPVISAGAGAYLVLAAVVEPGELLGGAVEALRGLGAHAT
jgi:hypothetical protein